MMTAEQLRDHLYDALRAEREAVPAALSRFALGGLGWETRPHFLYRPPPEPILLLWDCHLSQIIDMGTPSERAGAAQELQRRAQAPRWCARCYELAPEDDGMQPRDVPSAACSGCGGGGVRWWFMGLGYLALVAPPRDRGPISKFVSIVRVAEP